MALGPPQGADLTGRTVGLAMRVHRHLGPGLLESVYHRCSCHELSEAGIPFAQQVSLPIRYGDVEMDAGCRADIIAAREVILEIKNVDRILPLHEAQLLTCLRISSCRVGLVINFNTVPLTDGIRRCVP